MDSDAPPVYKGKRNGERFEAPHDSPEKGVVGRLGERPQKKNCVNGGGVRTDPDTYDQQIFLGGDQKNRKVRKRGVITSEKGTESGFFPTQGERRRVRCEGFKTRHGHET